MSKGCAENSAEAQGISLWKDSHETHLDSGGQNCGQTKRAAASLRPRRKWEREERNRASLLAGPAGETSSSWPTKPSVGEGTQRYGPVLTGLVALVLVSAPRHPKTRSLQFRKRLRDIPAKLCIPNRTS